MSDEQTSLFVLRHAQNAFFRDRWAKLLEWNW